MNDTTRRTDGQQTTIPTDMVYQSIDVVSRACSYLLSQQTNLSSPEVSSLREELNRVQNRFKSYKPAQAA